MIALITSVVIIKVIKSLMLTLLFFLTWTAYQTFYAKNYCSAFENKDRMLVVILLLITLFLNLLLWL